HDGVALVLAGLVVGDDDGLAGSEGVEHLGDRGEAHARLPAPAVAGSASDEGSERCASKRSIRSTWRARGWGSRVRGGAPSVSGITATANQDPAGSSPSALTVSETPSTATEPLSTTSGACASSSE